MPASRTSPSVTRPGGSINPMIANPVTLLPEPDSPTTATVSPGATENDTRCTACTVAREPTELDAQTVDLERRDAHAADPPTRIERVAQTVADEVDREHGEEDGEPGEHGEPPLVFEVADRVGQQVAPARRRRLDAETEERQRGLDEDRLRDHEGRVHDDRSQAVRDARAG